MKTKKIIELLSNFTNGYDIYFLTFTKDWVIFGRVMLFLVCTFWFVKIKRKKKSGSDVNFCYILKKFIGNMRNLVPNNL